MMSKFLFLTTFLSSFAALMFGLPFTSEAGTTEVEFQSININESLESLSDCNDDVLPIHFDGEFLDFHSAALMNDLADSLKGCHVKQVDLHIINRQGKAFEEAYTSTIEGFLIDNDLLVEVKVQSVYAEGEADIEGQGVLNILVDGHSNSA